VVTVDEALDIILSDASLLNVERVSILDALGRVLASDVIARREHPPRDNSAMDGYAVQWQDIKDATTEAPVVLKLVGEVQAGGIPPCALAAGQAMQIMTGAPIPQAADSVVRIEDTLLMEQEVKILTPCQKGRNIRRRGEDVHVGEHVISAGTRCRPAEVGMLATAGHVWAQVYQQPKVTVLATGNELVEPGELLGQEKIINSNGFSVISQVREAGAISIMLETASDTKADLEQKIYQALDADVAIIVGGVSMGRYDYVKEVLQGLGCDMKFWRVAIRPGHPVAFGVMQHGSGKGDRKKLIFGLPGNPVSCMVAFYQFVRPVLRKMMGLQTLFLPQIKAVLEEDTRSRAGRRHYARAISRCEGGQYFVKLARDQGSGILTSMVQADCLVIFPEEGGEFKAGDSVLIQLLPQ